MVAKQTIHPVARVTGFFKGVEMDAIIDGVMWLLIGLQVILTSWYGLEMAVLWWTGGRGFQWLQRDWWDW